ncbi:hypothetical protein [Candidatus Atelocyanobacterium thalassae]|jgi:hypothetical protein|uniref:OB-fold nucleic acid binding protein n=1 Tax=Atelocyanobacterium thalassa (isolate ALOHA) TaxID=1453429 RepID=D3EQ06_ATETH|nr:hypothetical protein [Candidatus Atelocyanobacterium thalassa]ADB95556.1 hypothetical protein UCYN_08720 [Candidatus Atelocyanobacterium thalassa isolate ALOHA]MCH2543278.1 hypothetical protein [Candidatus Atelocyanobacterium sp. ALOHA_A2.5_9]|tara:strand:- start:535 stop:951 length:417 start_codon:yes stop_codon:yes gene_type:complete
MKILNIRKVIVIIFLLIAGTSIGYAILNHLTFFQSSTISIQKLLTQKPIDSSLTHQVVYLEGSVVDHALFLDSSSYQLQDETGKIWVLKTFGEIPNIGEIIKIKGEIIYQPILIGNQDIGEFYIVELQRLDLQKLSKK